MIRIPRFFAIFFAATILYCGAAQAGQPPDFADVEYGANPENKMDIWTPKSTERTPVLIHFHDGGFTKGDKRQRIPKSLAQRVLQHKIAFVSANYRLVNSDIHFPLPQQDAARVVQFIRAHADRYNIDPSLVCVTGISAGGYLAVWLALHPNMAEGASSDVVARQSTRVTCALGYNAQTTVDPAWVMKHLCNCPEIFKEAEPFFGVSAGELRKPSPALKRELDDLSPADNVSEDDPPVFLSYKNKMTPVPLSRKKTSWKELVHHPYLGVLLQEKMLPLNLEVHVYWGPGGTKESTMPAGADTDFVLKQLGRKKHL